MSLHLLGFLSDIQVDKDSLGSNIAMKADILMKVRNCGFGRRWHFLILTDELKNLKDTQEV